MNLADAKNIVIQGLTGMGLVGLNISEALVKTFNLELKKSYAEFFPNVAIARQGTLEVSTAAVYHGEIDGREWWILTGPQPRTDELSALLLRQVVADFKEWNDIRPFDAYISFGAFVNTSIAQLFFEALQITNQPEKAIDRMIEDERTKERTFFVACCGGMMPKDVETASTTVKVEALDGHISGLNGTIPGTIGNVLGIPTASILIEAASADILTGGRFTPIDRFFGILASVKGLEFLHDVFGIDKKVMESLKEEISELLPIVTEELKEVLKEPQAQRKETSMGDEKTYI